MTRLSISRAMTLLARRDPGRLAVQDDETRLTRAELESRSNRLARRFRALGVGLDDTVTVAMPNTVGFVVAAVAAWKLGATVGPLSPRLPADETDAILRLADPALVVGIDRPGFRCVPDASVPDAGPGAMPGVLPDELPDGVLPDAAAACWKAPTSSGSTGHPKIVRATASAHVDPDAAVSSFLPREAVQLVASPLWHSAPFTYAMRGLMTGHSLVLLPHFDERRWLRAVDEHAVTFAMLVPTMMHRIRRLPAEERDAASLASLESILHIGAPCPAELKRWWIDRLGPTRVVEVYAGTESQGITTIRGDEWLEHPGSVGRPAGGSRMKVVDAGGRAVAAGVVGEILMIRDGGPSYRYVGAASRLRDGWDSLGDLGWMDDDGYLHIADRMDDLIVTGGAKVYPARVEAVLERHPSVRSAVVFGVSHHDLGEAVHAVVDVAEASPRASDLLDWGRARLDPEAAPRTIEVVHEPVRDDAGKVRRSRLRAERSA
jgi:bile acid-coenzyme A ligase